MSNDEYLKLGYAYFRRIGYNLGLDDEMLRRLDLSRDAVVTNIDRTSGRQLLDGVHKKLRKRMHPDMRKDVDLDSATHEFSIAENVYGGLTKLISKKIPDRDFFVALGIPVPNHFEIKPDTSRPTNNKPWRNNSQGPVSGSPIALFDPDQLAKTNQQIARYHKMQNLGFVAAGLALVGAAGVGLVPYTAMYEVVSAAVTGQPLNLGLLDKVEKIYPTTVTIGTIAVYAAVAVDLCRKEYSEVRRGCMTIYNDIRYG